MNPPVFQDIGQLDTEAHFLSEADCRVCHASGVPDRHHLLYGSTIIADSAVPFPGGTTYSCLSCHGQDFTVTRDCLQCHHGSPHHTGQTTYDRQCSECHGSLVADYDDGHYIPSYNPSLVTPWRGLHDDGWNDPEHTDPHREIVGPGTLADTDVLTALDTGITFAFGDVLTRTDPKELRFKPPGLDNDFMIDDPNRSGTYVYHVIFLQGGATAAVWDAGTDTLTVTLAPTQTVADLATIITAAVPSSGPARVRITRLTTDGSGPLLPADEYAPLGGSPPNHRGLYYAGACNYCHDSDGALDENGDLAPAMIVDNHDTHHHAVEMNWLKADPGALFPNPAPDSPPDSWRRCNVCHDYTTPPRTGTYSDVNGPGFFMAIRVCEECHSVESLHNIQADSPNPGNIGTIVVGGEDPGYGHVGADGGAGPERLLGLPRI